MFGFKDLLQQLRTPGQDGYSAGGTGGSTVMGSSGGDMVKVEANGAQEIVSIQIEKELLASDDPELLQDLIVAAVNDALRKSKDLVAQEMAKLTGGIKIPGLTI